MSNSVYPVLPGLSWDRVKTPIWSTLIQSTASGMESRGTYWSFPRWQFSLSYDLLRATTVIPEIHQLMSFFLLMRGRYDSFLYLDPDDHSVTGQSIGAGDGVKTTFQLARTMYNFTEPMKNIKGVPSIYVNSVLQSSGYAIDGNGIVTFTNPPATGNLITADFEYYFRCRFTKDQLDFNQFMYQLWELKTLEFISLKDSN